MAQPTTPGSLLSALAIAAVSLVGFAGTALAADVYRGVLQCAEIPGFTNGPMHTDLAVMIDGTRASFDRDIKNRQAGAEIGVAEHATGTVAGNQATLTSSVAQSYGRKASGWRFDGSYRVTIAGNQLKLVGEQVWTTGLVTGFHRPCHAELTR